MSERRVAGVLLAAGGSRRLGAPKQLLKTNGVTLVESTARMLLEASCDPVVVVTGANSAEVRDAVAMLPVQCVENVSWNQGIGSSIAIGVNLVNGVRLVDSVLIATCDMPSVSVDHLRALLSASEAGARVASEYAGASGDLVQGIPAVLPRADFDALMGLSGDTGARDLLRDGRTLTVFLRRGNFDLDTPADVAVWRADHGIAESP